MAISREDLLHWFNYDAETGVFRWKRRPARGGMSCKVGDVAGSVHTAPNGVKRRMLWLKGQRMYAARAAYVFVHGEIGPALVDHIDGDAMNDRIENLRLASAVQNAWNKAQVSGLAFKKGVTRDKRGRFKARIDPGIGRKINLGTWATEAEAHAAYMGACAMLHGEFALLKRPAGRRENGQDLVNDGVSGA